MAEAMSMALPPPPSVLYQRATSPTFRSSVPLGSGGSDLTASCSRSRVQQSPGEHLALGMIRDASLPLGTPVIGRLRHSVPSQLSSLPGQPTSLRVTSPSPALDNQLTDLNGQACHVLHPVSSSLGTQGSPLAAGQASSLIDIEGGRGRRHYSRKDRPKQVLPTEPKEASAPFSPQKGHPQYQQSRSCSASSRKPTVSPCGRGCSFRLDLPAEVGSQRRMNYGQPVAMGEPSDTAGVHSSIINAAPASSYRAMPSSVSVPAISENQSTAAKEGASVRHLPCPNTARRADSRSIFDSGNASDDGSHPPAWSRSGRNSQPQRLGSMLASSRQASSSRDRTLGSRLGGSMSPRMPGAPVQARELLRMRSCGPIDAAHRSSPGVASSFNRFGRELPPAPSAPPSAELRQHSSDQLRTLFREDNPGAVVRETLTTTLHGKPTQRARSPRSLSPSVNAKHRERCHFNPSVKVQDNLNCNPVWVDDKVFNDAESLQLRGGAKIPWMDVLCQNGRPNAATSFRSLSPPDIRSVGKAIAESNMRLREPLYHSILAQSARNSSQGPKSEAKRPEVKRQASLEAKRQASLGRASTGSLGPHLTQQSASTAAPSANESIVASSGNISADMSAASSQHDMKCDTPPLAQVICPPAPEPGKSLKDVFQHPQPMPRQSSDGEVVGEAPTPSTAIGTPGASGPGRSANSSIMS